MKKLLPISMLAMVTVCPAFADIDNESMCVVGTLNESSNNGNAGVQAIWTGAQYSENPGYYLLYDSQTDTLTPNTQCPAGSYCEGFTNQTFADATIGINTCPNGYTNSAQGSSANTDCFRTCTTSDVAHSTGTVNGGVYYNGTSGDGVNACEPTNCVTGYHVKAAVVAPNLTTLIGVSEAGTKAVYKSNNGTGSNSNASDLSTYGITHNGEFVVDYGSKGKIHGYARCSTRSATEPWGYDAENEEDTYELQNDNITETLPDSTGQYCYCQLDGYTPNGGTLQSFPAPWVFYIANLGAGFCATGCANLCASGLRDGNSDKLAFRAAVFSTIQNSPASCTPNTINLTWYSVGDTVYETNTCTYDQPITLPVTNPTRTGYIFSGWRLRTTPAQ